MPNFGGWGSNGTMLFHLLLVLGGAVIGGCIALLRGRVRVLEYTVTHDRIAISAADSIFGDVAATWRGSPIENLFLSRVELKQNSYVDYKDLKVTIYSNIGTQMLTERTAIEGSTRIVNFSTEYLNRLHLAPGTQPSQQQIDLYRSRREYQIDVFNRGRIASFTYLTTVPGSASNPGLWLEISYPGVDAKFLPLIPMAHGAPLKFAVLLGLAASIVAFGLCVIFVETVWIAALVCLLVAGCGQIVGALLYKLLRFIRAIAIR